MSMHKMTERMLNLTQEILTLLTKEEDTVIKKTSEECVASYIYRGWGRSHSPIMEPPPHSLIRERYNDQKILDLTNKMTELLTGEVPIRCQDVTVHFSMEEWEYVEGHMDLYKDIIMEDHQTPTLPDGSIVRRSPGRCPSPLYSSNWAQDHPKPLWSLPISMKPEILLVSEKHADHMTEKLLSLVREVFQQLSGEDYTAVKKTSGEYVTLRSCQHVSGGWNRSHSPIMEPPPHSLIPERCNDQKILDLTNKMIELLTGEVPIRCQDATVHFSMEEWEYIEGHTDLYKDVMMETKPPCALVADGCERDVKNITQESPRGKTVAQILYPQHSSRDLSSPNFNQEQPFSHTSDLITEHGGQELFLRSELEKKFTREASFLIQRTLTDIALLQSSEGMKYLKQKANFNNHQGIYKHVKKFSCALCLKRFNRKSYLVPHQRLRKGRVPFSCPQCRKYFATKSNLVKHPNIHTEEKQLTCPKCGKCFIKKSVLAKHQKCHKRKKLFLCSKCRKGFPNQSQLIHHRKIHTEEKTFSCSKIGLTFTKEHDLVGHRRTRSECEECKSAKSKLVQHQDLHLGEKRFSCPDCEKCFSKKLDLVKHKKSHTGCKPFSCLECGESFTKESKLISHQRSHEGENQFSCSECGKCYSLKSDLVDHQKSHFEEKVFSCVVCGKSFTQKEYLLDHMKIHLEQKLFKCNECEKCFSQKGGLITHQRIHTGEKPYSCPECDKKFAQKAGLIAHERTHTGEKPYSCLTCGKGFAQKAGLIAHERTHTGEKPFSCSLCGKTFAQKSGLVAHRRNHQQE